ncbi:MAG: hypothetical protein IPN07_15905 [Dehalococcoidia bacterium]|nr:hypothetical protein [Dehalococcoidia bacterium]
MAEASRWDGRLGPKQWLPLAAVLSLAIIGLSVLLALNLSDDSGGNPAASSGNGRVPTHEHADFLLFIRGQKFDFNQPGLVSHAEACILSELCIARIKPDEPPEECQGAGQCAK